MTTFKLDKVRKSKFTAHNDVSNVAKPGTIAPNSYYKTPKSVNSGGLYLMTDY